MIWNENLKGLLFLELQLVVEQSQELENKLLNVLEHSFDANYLLILLELLYIEILINSFHFQTETVEQSLLLVELIQGLIIEDIEDLSCLAKNVLRIYVNLLVSSSINTLKLLKVLYALIDLLHSINNAVKITFDANRSVSILIYLCIKINLSSGLGHDGLDVLAFLSNEHGAVLFRNQNRET